MIVEEAPGQRTAALIGEPVKAEDVVLPISARHPEALRQLIQRYVETLDRGVNVRDLCYSAARRRTHLPLRVAVAGNSAVALRSRLAERLSAIRSDVRAPGAASSELPPAAAAYERGDDPDWAAIYPDGQFVPLPNYPWQRGHRSRNRRHTPSRLRRRPWHRRWAGRMFTKSRVDAAGPPRRRSALHPAPRSARRRQRCPL